jgi:hypothetical protein
VSFIEEKNAKKKENAKEKCKRKDVVNPNGSSQAYAESGAMPQKTLYARLAKLN